MEEKFLAELEALRAEKAQKDMVSSDESAK